MTHAPLRQKSAYRDIEPRVLIPYDKREAISLQEAADIAGRSTETVRRWAHLNDLGRRIGGQWAISRVALAMWLDDDRAALANYLDGDRSSVLVANYFRRAGIHLEEAESHGR